MSQFYTLRHQLKGSQEAVNCLIFSPNGRILLSGGDDDSVRVWDLTSSQCIQIMHSTNWAQITSIEWLHRDSSPEGYSDWISIGTGRGSHTLCPKATEGTKFVWNEAATSFPFNVNDPIEAQAYDNINGRLALASHSGVLKVFKLRRKSLILLWEVNNTDIPRSLQFFGSGKRYLLTSFLEGGEIVCHNGEDSTIEWRRLLLGGIGNTAISPDATMLLVDNLSTNNFDLYRFPAGNLVATFASKSIERVVKGVTYIEGGKAAVCGSDQQFIQIIDLTMHRVCQELISENPSDLFQAVAAISLGDHRHLIACGSSSTKPTIYVWEKVDYTFDDRPTMSPGSEHHSHISTSTNRRSNVFDTLLVWFLQSLPIILLSTHSFWLPYFWQFVGKVGSISHAGTQISTELSRKSQDLSLEVSSLVVSVYSSSSVATSSSTFPLALTSTSASGSLPTLSSIIAI